MTKKITLFALSFCLALAFAFATAASAGPTREAPATEKTYERTCVGGRHIILKEVLIQEGFKMPGGRMDWRPRCNKVTLTFKGKEHTIDACEPLGQDMKLPERADYWCAPGRLKKFGIR